jgi:hypothetical protein
MQSTDSLFAFFWNHPHPTTQELPSVLLVWFGLERTMDWIELNRREVFLLGGIEYNTAFIKGRSPSFFS